MTVADFSQKTEQPTARRIDKARREGQFPGAKEAIAALQFLAFTALVSASGLAWLQSLRGTTRMLFARTADGDLTVSDAVRTFRFVAARNLTALLGAGALLVALGLGVRLATTGFGLSLNKLTPDFARLSPLAKLRELPKQNGPALLQAALLLPLFGIALYGIVAHHASAFLVLPLAPLPAGLSQVAGAVRELLWKAAGVFIVLGAVDFFRQRRRYLRDLRMSKQEIREEVKEQEGNPQVKARIRRIQRDLLRRRMMAEVPKATAVVVNPTHYAVALRYEIDGMAAPRVVAKGKNYLALRIRQKAVEHQVPIIENPPLAQALYKSVEVGQEIPAHLYRAVAEVLAYVYRILRGRLPA